MRVLLGVAIAILLVSVFPIASANHAQPTANGGTLTFTERAGGNEWWVEVLVTTTNGVTVSKVDATDTGGPWTAMAPHPDWAPGDWAASFHIEPGHQVTFRATTGTGEVLTSCPFTHPAGVEQCSGTQPPPPPAGHWTSQNIAQVPVYGSDTAVGDPDHDGKREVYVAGREGLYRIAQTTTQVSFASDWIHLAIGDADHDGQAEIYATRIGYYAPYQLDRFTFTNGAWQDQTLFIGNQSAGMPEISGPLTFGDIDHDGTSELYVLGVDGSDSTLMTVSQVLFANGAWQLHRVASHREDTRQVAANSVWAGDADGDGQQELAVAASVVGAGPGGSFVYVVDDGSAGWTFTRAANFPSGPAQGVYGPSFVVAGELGDGTKAIAALDQWGILWRIQGSGSSWTMTDVGSMGTVADALFLADGDGDGHVEMYASAEGPDGYQHAYQVRIAGTSASFYDMGLTQASEDTGTRIIVGDGDNDGKPEVYALTQDFQTDGHVFQFDFVPDASSGFDAIFTGVRGNEWWEQASVAAAGGTLSKVDVRLNGGAWQPLTKQSWGGWAASYHAVQGTVVQLRATSTAGATDLSDCYKWIPASNTDATKITCPGQQPPPPPPGPTITFSGVQGNEYWLEAVVKGSEPVTHVAAWFNDCTGDPHDLTYHADWGKWTLGTHIPAGTRVVLEASTASGSARSGGYVWPNATPTAGC